MVKSLYSHVKQGVFKGMPSKVGRGTVILRHLACFLPSAALFLLYGFHSQGFLVATDGPCSQSCHIHALGQCYSDHGPGHELFVTSLS